MKRIPKSEIEHLMWHPGMELPKPRRIIRPQTEDFPFTVKDLLERGQPFFRDDKETIGGREMFVGLPYSIEDALNHADTDGIVVSLPYLIAGKAEAEYEGSDKHWLWKNWTTAYSEENAGIDVNGTLVGRGEEIIVTVDGGGILTPERIRKAYSDGLTAQNAAQYNGEEFADLLTGFGGTLKMYSVDDVKNSRVINPFGRYAVWAPAEEIKATNSGYFSKDNFLVNSSVLMRSGTENNLDSYFDKAASFWSNGTVGNWYRFNEIDFSLPQGRLLFLSSNYDGLYGDSLLSYGGRCVGVRPEGR
jgi:hypothetical protein